MDLPELAIFCTKDKAEIIYQEAIKLGIPDLRSRSHFRDTVFSLVCAGKYTTQFNFIIAKLNGTIKNVVEVEVSKHLKP